MSRSLSYRISINGGSRRNSPCAAEMLATRREVKKGGGSTDYDPKFNLREARMNDTKIEKAIKAGEIGRHNDAGNPTRGPRFTPKGTFYGVEKFGTIWSFNPVKQIGSIIEAENNRYFFSKVNIIAGKPEIEIADKVKFFVDPTRPVRPGQSPVAYGISILDNLDKQTAGIDALAEKAEPEVE
jgi:hypothetical protein